MNSNERFKWSVDDVLSRPLPAWTQRSHRALPAITLRTDRPDRSVWLLIVFIARPVLALAGFIAAAINGWWPIAVVLSWLVYGSALTCVHHLIHSSLGLSARARRFTLRTIGLLVAESGHALQVTHLAHHRAKMDVPDPEGYIEYVSWRHLPFAAVAFRYRLMFAGLRMAPAARRSRIVVEIAGHAVLHVASLALLPFTVIPWVYISLIHVASVGFAVLAGKGPQTNYGRPIDSPFVRVHTRLGRILFFSHDQHLEHHAAPKVPLPRLRKLHPQIDAALDGVEVLNVRMPL